MIECKECRDYADIIFERGEITADEIPKLVYDRHALKACDKKDSPFLYWLEFAILNQREIDKEHNPFPLPHWNKGYLEALLDCRERYIAPHDSETSVSGFNKTAGR
ncbi:MAG TPA: hypothetical protein ACFYDZ_00255 [Candidatus Brocadiaceae bacterium]